MTAMPTGSPIAEARTGRLMTPWQKFFGDLVASLGGITGGTTTTVDDAARQEAADAVGDAAVLAARVAMLEKRLHDLEVMSFGVR